MKIQNFVHEKIAVLRLLPEDDEDQEALAQTRENLSRFTCCLTAEILLQEHPRKALSIIFTRKHLP